MFGLRKPWCPESIQKILTSLPAEFHFRLYNDSLQAVPHVDFRERGVRSFEVRYADTLAHKQFYLPQGRIAPDWCRQVIQGIQEFVGANDYLPLVAAQELGQEIITRLQLGDEAQTDDSRNVVLYLGKYPLEQRRRILQFLLELDEDAPWAVVEFHLYQVRADEAQRVRTALDIMEAG